MTTVHSFSSATISTTDTGAETTSSRARSESRSPPTSLAHTDHVRVGQPRSAELAQHVVELDEHQHRRQRSRCPVELRPAGGRRCRPVAGRRRRARRAAPRSGRRHRCADEYGTPICSATSRSVGSSTADRVTSVPGIGPPAARAVAEHRPAVDRTVGQVEVARRLALPRRRRRRGRRPGSSPADTAGRRRSADSATCSRPPPHWSRSTASG